MKITAKTTKQELKTYLDDLKYKTVTRKQKTAVNVKGEVVGYKACRKGRKPDGDWQIKLIVEWEGAANGTRRFNGSAWNTTSTIKIDSLVFENH